MGSSTSRESGPLIGVWSDGRSVYQNTPLGIMVRNSIANGSFKPVTGEGNMPMGHSIAFLKYNIEGDPNSGVTQYASEAHVGLIRKWWDNHKTDLYNSVTNVLSSSGKLTKETVAEITAKVLPVLADQGADAARVVLRGIPAASGLTDPIIDVLNKQLKQIGHNVDQYSLTHGAPKAGGYDGVSDYAYHGAVQEAERSNEVHGGMHGGMHSGEYVGSGDMEDNIGTPYNGGCGTCKYIGAADLDISSVREYGDSLNSKAKLRIIDEIVDAGRKMGMKVTGEDQQSKVRSLLSQLPDDKTTIKNESQAQACIALANAINNAHGSEIVSKKLPPAVICQQVAEIVSSLAAGMHTEFLAVYNDVRKVLKNLHILKNALKDDHAAIVSKMKGSDDALLAQEITTLNDLHGVLTDEVDRQIQLLSNLLNVTLFPAEKDIAALIKSKKDLHGYIEKIDLRVGSESFGKVVADILKGLGITANFALLIERALKTVGLTMDEYAKGESVKKLREKITQGMMGKNMDESQLHEYLEAAELLYKNFYRGQDIAKVASTTKTGNYQMRGGADEYQKTVLDKRVADRRKVRNLIFSAFHRQVNDLFDQMVGAVDTLTAKVGTDVPLSEQLNSFRHILQRVDEELIRNKNIYHAIIGYYNDAMSKSKKDRFIGDLKMVSSYIETIVEMPMYAQSKQYFINIQSIINAIVQLVDKFSDEIAAKFGRGEPGECQYLEEKGPAASDVGTQEPIIEGQYEFPDAIYGGEEGLDSDPKIKFKTTKSIHDAIRQFDYRYRVAQIRSNLATTSKELSHYSEKYEKIIANSIADILIDDKKIYEKLRQQLTDDSYFGDPQSYAWGVVKGFLKRDEVQEQREAARKFLDHQWEVKKKFWATVEAVDSYMRVFTDALVSNPQDIKEIKSMLDSIEVIGDWYKDSTGDDLVSVFEQFPSYMNVVGNGGGVGTGPDNTAYTAREVVYPPESYSKTSTGTHYYQRIHAALHTTDGAAKGINGANDRKIHAYPGNPYLVTLPTLGETAKAQAKKTLNGLAILKNLLSVFIHVGNKFGGEKIHQKIFMTPSQIYNNLVEYISTSAFAMGFGFQRGMALTPTGDLPPEFYNSQDISMSIDLDTGASSGSTAPVAAQPWNPTTTYNNDGTVVVLGITADNTHGITDYHYGVSRMADALVDKINVAAANIETDIDTVNRNRARYTNDMVIGLARSVEGTNVTSALPVPIYDRITAAGVLDTFRAAAIVDIDAGLAAYGASNDAAKQDISNNFEQWKLAGAALIADINQLNGRLPANAQVTARLNEAIGNINDPTVADSIADKIAATQRAKSPTVGQVAKDITIYTTQLRALLAPGTTVGRMANNSIQNPAGMVNPGGIASASTYQPQTWGSTAQPAQKVLLFKKRWGIWMRSILTGLRDREGFSFKREDEYFVLIMKSLAAKILTVTGMYDVFDRPIEFNGLSPIRMITGGSAETPKVDENAIALYLRLPLLAQFYRGIFGFSDGNEDPNNPFHQYNDWRARPDSRNIKISMVPDVDGVFAGLIRLVFRKNKFTTGGNYSDEDMKELIREINLIYQRMQSKYPQNTVMETINEFVAEINRRYGIVSKQERNEWEREFGYRYDYSSMSNTDRSNPSDRYDAPPDIQEYAILPGEEDEEVERPSAAQRLLGETLTSSAEKKRLFTITTDHKDLVYRFRCAIDKYFEKPDEEYTFNHAIKSTQMKLKKEQNDEARFKIVAALVRGVDIYTKTDGMKCVLFHETVVAGLNALSAIHTMLARFKRRAHVIDLGSIEREIWNYFSAEGIKNHQSVLLEHISNYLCNELGLAESEDAEICHMIEQLFGHGEAGYYHGGHYDATVNDADNHVLKGGDGIPIIVNNAPNVVARWPALVGHFGSVKLTNGSVMISTDQRDANNNARAVINDTHGLCTVLAGFTVQQLKEAYEAPRYTPENKAAKQAAETFMRFIFGREYVMTELLESLFGLSNDFQGLVDVRIDDGKLLLSCGGLKTLIDDMFQHVSYFLDLLRPHIKEDIISKYTDKFNPGSYYWLQEQLIEKIIIGRPRADQPLTNESTPRTGYASLDELMQRLSYTYSQLTRKWFVDGAGLRAVGMSTAHEVPDGSYNSFDKVFAKMIFYDASCPGSGLLRSQEADKTNPATFESIEGIGLADYMHNPYDALHFNGPASLRVMDTRFVARFKQLYSWKDDSAALSNNKSAMFMFNQLIAKYLQTFYDPVSGKIYSGAIDKFANGAFSRPISDFLYTYPDTVPLWFIKYVGASDIKIPGTMNLSQQISAVNVVHINPVKDLLQQYLKIGIKPGDHSDESRRVRLFNMDNTDLLSMVTVATADNDASVPMIYIYLLTHLIGRSMKHVFDALVTAGAVADSQVAGAFTQGAQIFLSLGEHDGRVGNDGNATTLAQAAARLTELVGNVATVTFGALCNLYTGDRTAVPTLEQIMDVLLNTTNEIMVLRCIAAVGRFTGIGGGAYADRFKIPAANSPLALVNTAGAFANADIALIITAFNTILRAQATIAPPNDKWGDMLAISLQHFPFQNDAFGRTLEARQYRLNLFTHFIVAMGGAYNDAVTKGVNAVAVQQAYTTKEVAIINAISTVKSVYTVPTSAQPKYIAKYEDLLLSTSDFLTSANIGSAGSDVNYLIMARDESVQDILGQGSMKGLGLGKEPPAGSNQSDKLAAMRNFGRRADPDGEHVLFSSLAQIIRNIVTSRNDKTSELIHVHNNVADIALYMKEKIRGNMPYFRNLFKELARRCEFIKLFIGRKELNLMRSYAMVADEHGVPVGAPKHNPWPYQLKPVTTESAPTKDRFISILDSVIHGCNALSTSCEQVLREVGDDPKYFELYQGSIKDYKSQYGVDPLMPLSTTMSFFKNVNNDNYADFLPIHPLGKDQFKLHYGTRSLIGQPTTQPLPEHILGFSQIVDAFNLITDTKLQVDKARADGFMKTFVRIMRYIHELKHVKGIITPFIWTYNDGFGHHPNAYSPTNINSTILHINGSFTRNDLIVTGAPRGKPTATRNNAAIQYGLYGKWQENGGDEKIVILTNRSDVSLIADGLHVERATHIKKRKYPTPVYAIAKPITDSIRLTESSFKDDRLKELVDYICESSVGRNTLEVQNIIDLNIVPINIHALRREIPLINLYNYSYTFDRLIIELYYGLQNENARKLISELCNGGNLGAILSAKDLLVALLIDPYKDLFAYDASSSGLLSERLYDKHAKSMLAGAANNGELGRPKFLSDQIFNKVIFGELYTEYNEYNEAGPVAPRAIKVNADKQFGIRLIGDLTAIVISALNSGGKFRRGLLDAAASNDALRNLCTAVAGYVADNTSVTLEVLYKLIMEKFLKLQGGIAEFKALAVNAGADDNNNRQLGLLVGMVTIMIYTQIATLVNSLLRTDPAITPTIAASTAAKDIMATLAMLNGLGARADGSPYLGLSITINNNAADVGSVDDAVKSFIRNLQANANVLNRGAALDAVPNAVVAYMDSNANPVATTGNANYVSDTYETAFLVNVLRKIAVSNPLPIAIARNRDIVLPNIKDIYTHMMNSISERIVRETTSFKKAVSGQLSHDSNDALHWLDSNLDEDRSELDMEERGAMRQPKPRGDNKNVLDDGQIKSVNVKEIKQVLSLLGRLRFDTILIRNLIFIVDLYRSVRMKLQRDLVYSKDIVLRAEPITRPQLTEFYGNRVLSANDKRPYTRSTMWTRYDY